MCCRYGNALSVLGLPSPDTPTRNLKSADGVRQARAQYGEHCSFANIIVLVCEQCCPAVMELFTAQCFLRALLSKCTVLCTVLCGEQFTSLFFACFAVQVFGGFIVANLSDNWCAEACKPMRGCQRCCSCWSSCLPFWRKLSGAPPLPPRGDGSREAIMSSNKEFT